MKKKIEREWWIFFVAVSLVTLAFVGGITIGVGKHVASLFSEQVRSEAAAHFHNIVLTRRWNALHGGVYVLKSEGVKSNPYLENPDITTTNGTVYTMKNPALMTREISTIAGREDNFTYHITSLRPLNPNNAADPFEAYALELFENGETEVFEEYSGQTQTLARYMAPLMVEEACMQCHAHQGYAVGDVRGGISVSLDVTGLRESLKTSSTILYLLVGVCAISLLTLVILFSMRLIRRLKEAQETIHTLAVTDELTGAYNRRQLYEFFNDAVARNQRYGHPISVVMVDIDHFKVVNDTYGHLAGDEVLKRLVQIMNDNLRETDLVARFGGEEFIILLPGEEMNQAIFSAQRIRMVVEQTPIIFEDVSISLTVSCGISTRDKDDLLDPCLRDIMFSEADKSLYAAKMGGRNRTVHFNDLDYG